jgi:hypothetical protein
MTTIEIPERGTSRVVPACEVALVQCTSPRHVLGWDGHVTLRSGERIATVDVQRVLRQVDAIKRERRRAQRRTTAVAGDRAAPSAAAPPGTRFAPGEGGGGGSKKLESGAAADRRRGTRAHGDRSKKF